MCIPTIVRYRADRRGPGWRVHGTTSELVWVFDATRQRLSQLTKRSMATGVGADKEGVPLHLTTVCSLLVEA